MDISIFGTGYVGLVQGAVLAASGHRVTCIDVDSNKIENLKKGIIPIYEPGLEPLVKEGIAQGLLKFTTEPTEAVLTSQVLFIAVGTPPEEDGSADLKHVISVAKTIGKIITGYTLIVNKSTVPVGTADLVRETISKELSKRGLDGMHFDVASNPEFLKEGCAVQDASRPDRIVIGVDNDFCASIFHQIYAGQNRNHDKIIKMDIRSAELTKYAANCMLATKISFMNEIALIAEKVGADIESIRKGIGSDPRIGYHFIYAGAGYGGSCFPKDVRALIRTANIYGLDPYILESIERRNNEQKSVLFHKIMAYYEGDIRGKTFALWGLSFKPNTDDMREAPSKVLIEKIIAQGAKVKAFDPEAMDRAQLEIAQSPSLSYCQTRDEALKGASALVVLTEWQLFRSPDFMHIKQTIQDDVVFDGRNIYDPEILKSHALDYVSIGRKDSSWRKN